MDELDRVLINRLEAGIGVVERPFANIATELGIAEAEACGRLERLMDEEMLSRFGALIDADALGGALTLAALSVPAHDFDRTAALGAHLARVCRDMVELLRCKLAKERETREKRARGERAHPTSAPPTNGSGSFRIATATM